MRKKCYTLFSILVYITQGGLFVCRYRMAGAECPVCLCDYTDPRSLPCGHTFCQQCIQRMTAGRRIQCPVDRRSFDIPPNGFTRNYALQDVLQQPPRQAPQTETSRVTPSAPPLSPNSRAPGNTTNYEIFFINAANNSPNIDRNESGNGTRPPAPRELNTCQWPRTKVRHALKMVFDDSENKTRTMIAISALLVMTFSRFVAGAVKLSSDCDKEYDVAAYLFVKSWFAFLFWISLMILVVKKKLLKALKNKFYELYLVVHTGFAFIWFILGNVWVFGRYDQMQDECPLEEFPWNESFIEFAVFLTVVDWLLVTFFTFYFLYLLFDDDDDDDEDE